MSKSQRLLAYTLLSLITSTPMNETSITSISEDDNEDECGECGSKQPPGHMNSDGAWCWREGCLGGLLSIFPYTYSNDIHTDCLQLTKAMQKTSDTLQTVADLYDDHVRSMHCVVRSSP